MPANHETIAESDSAHARTIKRLESQMSLIDDQLDKAKEPAAWRDLTTARMRLFDQWCVLCGIHKPGPSKAPRESTRRARVVVLPQESLDPGPVQPVKAAEPEPSKYWDYEGC